ncbi:3-oxoacyl-[acyl-carrier-protein] synthase [Orbilia blumenaviensis]|uniref:3-oxoacyl-[acyl-carrier-protein] synthase n=1 Tax=Orbilia blumenaviensis TaxID=1796055 RepID=A0AAV9V5D4_9PEZI
MPVAIQLLEVSDISLASLCDWGQSVCESGLSSLRFLDILENKVMNNITAEAVEKLGVRTFSGQNMAFNLLGLMAANIVNLCQAEPVFAKKIALFRPCRFNIIDHCISIFFTIFNPSTSSKVTDTFNCFETALILIAVGGFIKL